MAERLGAPQYQEPCPQRENEQFSNVQVLLLVGQHIVRSETEFATKRKSIEETGEKFFKRNFTNIYVIEDASGNIERHSDEINEFVGKTKSFRSAYWQILRHVSDKDTQKLLTYLDRNPAERLLRMHAKEGLDHFQAASNAFAYTQLTALDNLLRKNIRVQLRGETPSAVRRNFLSSIDGIYGTPKGVAVSLGDQHSENSSDLRNSDDIAEMVKYAKMDAEMIDMTNADLASQLTDIAIQNPSRLRLMSVMGTGHSGVFDYLPEQLQKVGRLEKLIPDAKSDELLLLTLDIMKSKLTDSEIAVRAQQIIDLEKKRLQ